MAVLAQKETKRAKAVHADCERDAEHRVHGGRHDIEPDGVG